MARAGTLRVALAVLLLGTGLAPASAQTRCADHVPQARPQNASRDIVGADLDTIQERGWISFAVYEDYPPWSWEENGAPRGVDIDLGHLIAGELGVEARFTLVAAGENLEADLRNWIWKGPIVGGRVANVMLHVPYDSNFACRVEQVVFTGQYHVERMGIAFGKAEYPERQLKNPKMALAMPQFGHPGWLGPIVAITGLPA